MLTCTLMTHVKNSINAKYLLQREMMYIGREDLANFL